jgi:hypothetical protein
MRSAIRSILVLAVLAALLAGCGGGGSKSTSGGSGGSSGPGNASGLTVGNCLNNDENFLVQPNASSVDGMSPAGVSFTMTFYKTDAAAAAAEKKKNPKTSALVENTVIDFKGNPSIYQGAPPAKISKVELASIKRCLDKANK